MKDVYLLLWLYPKDKRALEDLKCYSFDQKKLSEYLKYLFRRSVYKIEELKNLLNSEDISIVTIKDDLYPKRLKEAPYAPLIFSYQGNFNTYLNSIPVSMIGSRRLDPKLEEWIYESFKFEYKKIHIRFRRSYWYRPGHT